MRVITCERKSEKCTFEVDVTVVNFDTVTYFDLARSEIIINQASRHFTCLIKVIVDLTVAAFLLDKIDLGDAWVAQNTLCLFKAESSSRVENDMYSGYI